MKRPKILLLNISGIGCRSTSIMSAQNKVCRAFDILIDCLDIGI